MQSPSGDLLHPAAPQVGVPRVLPALKPGAAVRLGLRAGVGNGSERLSG